MLQINLNYQYMAMCAGSLLAISVGVNAGWSSPYLQYLLNPEISHIATSEGEGFWCAVAPLLGAPLGTVIALLLVDRIGRKYFLLSTAPICAACYLSMSFANTILALIIPRFIIGSIEGAMFTTLPMYYGEIAHPNIRGIISASLSVASLMGIVLINLIGPFLTIGESSLLCSALPILYILMFMWMPESPYYLLKIGNHVAAKNSLVVLRGGDDEDVLKELEEITAAVRRQEGSKQSIFDLFSIRSNRKAFMIFAILSFTSNFCGKNPVTLYTMTIFAKANGSVDPVLSTIIFSLVGLIMTIVALFQIDRFGRRPLMLFSGTGCALALIGEASYFTIQNFFPDQLPYIGWLPLLSLIAFNMVCSLGLSFGPVLFLSELFPTSVKAKALFAADNVAVVMSFMASKYFQATSDSFGMFVPFWTFSLCTILGTLLIYVYVPETKGKTLEQIQLELIGDAQASDKSG